MSFGPCMCGDTACRSCGPAQGAPCCEYSTNRCGDKECWCAESTKHHDPEDDDPDLYVDELAEEARLYEEWREGQILAGRDDH